ncbi:MAG TPA: YebC/PmpR family DNA-binding transcriptional regulator [Acidimicrobiia bacterium]
MSGHSKWSTIKRRKGAQDAKRGRLFAKLIRAIEVAARQGGGDPAGNPSLATAIDKARNASVPNENIERAIARGSGALDGSTLEELWYEGYAPGGVALYVRVLTDNRNRAASDVRATFTRHGGNLGEPGSVAYLFEQKGYLLVEGEEDEVMSVALEAGADDLRATNGLFEVITDPSQLPVVRDRMEGAGLHLETAEVTRLPKATVPVDRANAGRVLRLLDLLEDLDDVQEVYANFDIPDEVMEELQAEV